MVAGVRSKHQRPPKPHPYSFLLELDGEACARFRDATGLNVPHGTPRKTLILRGGVTTGTGLQTWRKQGNVPPREGALIMRDGAGVEKGRWKFRGARVSKWIGPDLSSTATGVTLLELTCESIDGA
jgi:hypothetical protein